MPGPRELKGTKAGSDAEYLRQANMSLADKLREARDNLKANFVPQVAKADPSQMSDHELRMAQMGDTGIRMNEGVISNEIDPNIAAENQAAQLAEIRKRKLNEMRMHGQMGNDQAVREQDLMNPDVLNATAAQMEAQQPAPQRFQRTLKKRQPERYNAIDE